MIKSLSDVPSSGVHDSECYNTGMERTYTPGVCNPSDAEARARNAAGWIGLVLVIGLEALFLYTGASPVLRLAIFLPAAFGAMGFLQGLLHFCVNFGMRGVFNMTSEVGKTDTVAQAQYRAQDRAKAWRIIIYSLLIGIAVAIIAYIS